MKTRFIKRLGLFTAFLMMFSCFFGFDGLVIQAKAEGNLIDNREQIVRDYFDCVDRGDWEQWVDCYVPSVRESYRQFVSDKQSHLENRGILTINSVDILDLVVADNHVVPKFYPELQSFFESEDTYACYYVRISTTVKEDNGYFGDGASGHYVVLVCENGQWGVGVICGAPDFQLESSLIQPAMATTLEAEIRGVGTGFLTCYCRPTLIDVKDELGGIHRVYFKDFVINATCNEIGNMGYCTDAIKANVIAIKMFGWWAQIGKYREAEHCHIKNGDVNYMSTLETTEANTQMITNVVNDVWGYRMVSSVATGGMLFSCQFFAGEYDTSGKGSGKMRQNGSQYLGATLGYTWRQILDYYYSNSSFNNPNVGTVQILSDVGNHICTTYTYNNSYHMSTCSRCGYKVEEGHYYRSYSTYVECEICGKTVLFQ